MAQVDLNPKPELPSNREALKPVVRKEAIVTTKKSLGQKFKEAFVSEDTKDVKSYIFLDVVIPTIKETILNVGEMILFGTPGGRRGDYYRGRSVTTYDKCYNRSSYGGRTRRARDRDREERYEADRKVDYRNIILRTRMDAEDVIRELHHRIETYDQATIADLFDLIDVASNYVDNNWGWTDPNDIGIRRVSAGYLIDVAEAKYLD